MGGGEEKHFCFKTMWRTFLEIKAFCVTFWLYSALNKREDHLLRIFLKILWSWLRLKAFLFYNKVENLSKRYIVLFVIDFFVTFSSKQKWKSFFSIYIAHF